MCLTNSFPLGPLTQIEVVVVAVGGLNSTAALESNNGLWEVLLNQLKVRHAGSIGHSQEGDQSEQLHGCHAACGSAVEQTLRDNVITGSGRLAQIPLREQTAWMTT